MSLARSLVLVVAAGHALSAAAQSVFSERQDIRVSEILGREVSTAQGERLAIRDLLIAPGTGKVEYLALGHADGEVFYPVDALRSAASSELRLVAPDDSSSSGASAPSARLRVSQFVGRLVQDGAGKELGRIQDMVVRLADGTVSFALLAGKAEDAPLRVPAEAFYDSVTQGLVAPP
jgi:sporulation protein YlmC with PRC-barrel domain